MQPKIALVRNLPKSFSNCLKMHDPEEPIDIDLAHQQHQNYIEALKSYVPKVVNIEADETFPDCCFIEDTAVVIGETALVNIPGAPERRGEEKAVKKALEELGVTQIHSLSYPGTVDGGDVLFTGRHIIVGISKRTNEDGVRQLSEIFGSQFPVISVPVHGTLHLKSVISAFDSETLIVAANEAGNTVVESLQLKIPSEYEIQWVPDTAAANVLSLGSTIFIQNGYPLSEGILLDLAARKKKEVVRLTMSELIKADGALTCCSIVF